MLKLLFSNEAAEWGSAGLVFVSGAIVGHAASTGMTAEQWTGGVAAVLGSVALAVMVIRRTDPGRRRPFRTPMIYLTAPIAIAGCVYLFFNLDQKSIVLFLIWAAVGLLVYFGYSRSRSHVGRGIVDVPELEPDAPPPNVVRPADEH